MVGASAGVPIIIAGVTITPRWGWTDCYLRYVTERMIADERNEPMTRWLEYRRAPGADPCRNQGTMVERWERGTKRPHGDDCTFWHNGPDSGCYEAERYFQARDRRKRT